MTLDPNDLRLTAYALGELEGDELAEVETQIARSKALRLVVEEIRVTTDLLKKNLQNEPILALTHEQRALIESRLAETAPSQGQGGLKVKGAKTSFLRRHLIPTALAASLLVAVGVGYLSLPSLMDSGVRAREDIASALRHRELKTDPTNAVVSERKIRPANVEVFASAKSLPARESISAASVGQPEEKSSTGKLRQLQSLGYVSGGGGGGGGQGGGGQGGGGQSVFGGFAPKRADQLNRFLSPSSGYGYRVPIIDLKEERDALGETPSGAEYEGFEAYDYLAENPFLVVTQNPLSTFSIDVDTASYSNVRRFLMAGQLPPRDAVRIEELVNYFDYDYPPPTGEHPFSMNVEVADCPWVPTHRLARIGIKGMEFAENERPPANLVFLIDVSGSMQPPNRLPLLQQGLRMLVDGLSPKDSVAIVVYAGASGLVLPSTPCRNRGVILSALDNLSAGGSTNGGAGIQLAYNTASGNFIEGGVNRVILATDGDFNVGVTDRGDLLGLIEEKAKSGVFLTVLGVGMGNLKDATLETLADKGNGNYAYIDSLNEAKKVLVDQIGGTLVTIAKDVKIQVEFNPAVVSAYRLIGYENRLLAAQDFNDDAKDAGEIGAGHTVTAFYEIVPVGEQVELPSVDPLKYQTPTVANTTAGSGELMTVKLRYKQPDGDTSELIEMPVMDADETFADSSDDFAFATAVASFGMLLRGSPHSANFNYAFVRDLADAARGADPNGYRAEFIDLANRASGLSGR